jgi:hypothetical protein
MNMLMNKSEKKWSYSQLPERKEKMKYLGINLKKKVKDLCNENCKTKRN